jgi:hypothetical protein
LGVIRQAAAAAFQTADGDEPDHLALARSVINGVGQGQHHRHAVARLALPGHRRLAAAGDAWREADRAGAPGRAHDDQTITKKLVDSVTDTLRNEVYRPARVERRAPPMPWW